jgi:hypothetical protein
MPFEHDLGPGETKVLKLAGEMSWPCAEQPLLGRRGEVPWIEAGDFEAGRSLGGLNEVVVELEAKPNFKAAAKRLGQPDGHIRRNARPPVDEIVKRLPRHAQMLGRIGDGEPKRLDALLSDNPAWMWGGCFILMR